MKYRVVVRKIKTGWFSSKNVLVLQYYGVCRNKYSYLSYDCWLDCPSDHVSIVSLDLFCKKEK